MLLLLLQTATVEEPPPVAVGGGGAPHGPLFGDPVDPYALARLDDDLLLLV